MGVGEAPSVVERGPEGRGGHRADARRGHEPLHACVRRGDGRKTLVSGRNLVVPRREYRERGGDFGAQRLRRGTGGVEHGQLRRRALGVAGGEAQPVTPHQHLEHGDESRASAHQRVAHRELGTHVALRLAEPVGGSVRAESARLAASVPASRLSVFTRRERVAYIGA